MSKTDGFVVLDAENKGKEKKAPSGNLTRKKLSDISNLPLQARVSTLDEKSHLMPIATKEYVDQLKKENMTLVKMLAERNKIIEVTSVELQKLRVNMRKLQEQNWELAKSNSQMLADLNSRKDRMNVLQHELSCKNALLMSKKLEIKERVGTSKCGKLDDEVELTNCEAPEVNKVSSKVCKVDDKCGNTGRRPKSKSLGPRKVQSKDENENKRPCVRRQSARFRTEELKSASELLETEDVKVCVHVPGNGVGPPQKNGSASVSISIQDEGMHPRRYDTERKRQSPRLKSEEPRSSNDLLGIDDAKTAVSVPSNGALLENGSTSVSSFLQDQDTEANLAPEVEALRSRRSSFIRPSRQAAKKIQSYKEIPLNMKMRRSQ